MFGDGIKYIHRLCWWLRWVLTTVNSSRILATPIPRSRYQPNPRSTNPNRKRNSTFGFAYWIWGWSLFLLWKHLKFPYSKVIFSTLCSESANSWSFWGRVSQGNYEGAHINSKHQMAKISGNFFWSNLGHLFLFYHLMCHKRDNYWISLQSYHQS